MAICNSYPSLLFVYGVKLTPALFTRMSSLSSPGKKFHKMLLISRRKAIDQCLLFMIIIE